MSTLRAAGTTDAGQVRGQNQDSFFVRDDLVLIADGMGGYAGGEVAAEIAVDVVASAFASDTTARGLAEAFHDANRRIFERGGEPGLEGMGTTLVGAALVATPAGERLLVANVGDSRGYLLRDGALRQLTEDHSVAAELVRMGRIEEQEEGEHPGRHVLTRALGVEEDVAPDVVELEPRAGDRLLLCSDGLSNELGESELRSLLEVGEPSDAARALVAAANAHGGLDNITAVVADVVTDPTGAASPARESGTSPEPLEAIEAPSGPGGGVALAVAPSAVAVAEARTGTITRVSAPTIGVPIRPVLTAREQRRRRREEYRARRSLNKWVSIRGAVFLLAIAAVLVGAYAVLRWYGTSNYVATVQGRGIIVLQGQTGGFLWWPQKVVYRFDYGQQQIPQLARPALRAGVQEPSRAAAIQYVNGLHAQWKHSVGNERTGSTTSTTYAPYAPQG